MTSNINCPISKDKADENIIRIASLLSLFVLTIGTLLRFEFIIFLLAVDFAIRAFTDGKYSIIRTLSKKIGILFKLREKHIDSAPKKFAAGLGAAFSIIIGIFLLTGNIFLAYAVAVILGICALLEGIFAICIGCHIYSWLIIPLIKTHTLKILFTRNQSS